MVIAEPPSTLGLWPRVWAMSGWPLSDEDRVRALAESWRTGAVHFATAGEFDPAPLADLWPDTAGVDFHRRVQHEVEAARSSADAMQNLANRCDHLADVVIGVKTAIRTLIETNLDRYASTRALAPEDRADAQQSFVARLAGMVNELLTAGADQIGGPPPLPPPAPPPPPPPQADPLAEAGAFLADVGNEAASFGNAALNNPGLVLAAAGGVGLTAVSGAGVLAGAGLTATGGGAVAGAPLTGLSLAGVATGGALAVAAVAAISDEAGGADRVTPFGEQGAEAAVPQPDPAAAAPPATDWDAVTGGRPADEYEWAKPNAPTDVLEPEERWDPSKGVPILGRQPDTKVGRDWPDHDTLDIEPWSPEQNDAYIQTIIDQEGTVYAGTPTQDNYWNSEKQQPTVYAREIQQLLQAGYTWNGAYLVPPG